MAQIHRVTSEDTAEALGSGDLPVLATPRLIAWCEQATCSELDLPPEQSSVGTRISFEHVAASAVDEQITCSATVTSRDGRLVIFEVAAVNGAGSVVGHGEIRRVIVDRQRFMARITHMKD